MGDRQDDDRDEHPQKSQHDERERDEKCNTKALHGASIAAADYRAGARGLFPTRTRQTGLSIAYACASVIAGIVPYLLTLLIDKTGNEMMPALTLMVLAVLGLATLLTMKETRGISLLENDLAEIGEASVDTTPSSPPRQDPIDRAL